MPFIDLPDGPLPGIRARVRDERPWYQFKNVTSDEAELFLYEEIGGWGTLAEDFIAELKQITAPKLRVRVSSPGGNVFEGVALANALRAHPGEVTVQVDGIAASIASVIAMAGDRVVIQPQAMIMVHEAAGGCLGNAKDMQDMADLLDKISNNIAGAYAAKAGGDVAEWRQVMVKETWYTAEEAVEAGLADEMVQPKKKAAPDDEPEMRTFDLTAYGYQGPKQPEAPKPGPPPAGEETAVTLTFNVGGALDEQMVEDLRAMVRRQTAPTAVAAEPVVEPEPEPEPVAEPEVPAEPEPEPVAAEPVDEWAAAVAHLTQPQPDPWAALVARYTNSTSAASSATHAA